MLSFARVTESKTLLENISQLTKFNPTHPNTHNSLRVNKNGKIEVFNRMFVQPEWYELAQKLEANLPVSNFELFAQEKMVLIWHLNQLLPYIEQRFYEILRLPKTRLHDYYVYGLNIHGFYQLCHNMYWQIENFNTQMIAIEKQHQAFSPLKFRLLQQELDNNYQAVSKKFLKQLNRQNAAQQDLIEKDQINVSLVSLFGPVISIDKKNTLFKIGKVTLFEENYVVDAYFGTRVNSSAKPARNPFTDSLCVSINIAGMPRELGLFMNNHLMLYPSWHYEKPTARSEKSLGNPAESSGNYLKEHSANNGLGAIAYGPINLCAHFELNNLRDNLLPYFMLMVQVAKHQAFNHITLYAPYNFSAIAKSFGFSSIDDEAPTAQKQQTVIDNAMEEGQDIELMDDVGDKVDADGNTLLRPFCFYLAEYESKTVYLPLCKETTTYSVLLKGKAMYDMEKYPKGIIPEFNQAPLSFTPSFTNIKAREHGRRLTVPTVMLCEQKIDYSALESSEKLQALACSDPKVAKASGYTKQRVLRKYF